MEFTAEQIANGKAWITALRSGEYRQGRYALRRHTPQGIEYCCLGVAQAVLNVPKTPFTAQYLDHDAAEEVLGLQIGVQSRLSGLNDGGASFDLIADVIEKYYGLTEQAV
jgi:hypothetical protein